MLLLRRPDCQMLLLKKLSRTWTDMVFQSLKVVALC